LAPENFLPFGLRDAARDNDFGLPPAEARAALRSRSLPSSEKTFSAARSLTWQVFKMTRSASSNRAVPA
jgi:hypothetical protein